MTPRQALQQRLAALEAHLRTENPNLLPVIPTFRSFDRLLVGLGLLRKDESLATRIPWWPMVAVLGTFSAGKSTFMNGYLGAPLQRTGNQAVDDKFTVICHGPEARAEALPGTALNADPRFPFYRIADEIEKVAAGEGKRIDNYLQLKTLNSERTRGKIFIDSPGFDADDQRRSVLRLVDHIVELSDLVLVFFDARHPEPGAMQDTLQHLVAKTVNRADARKVLYVLNQVDTTAKEDNLEAVFGAWQRAIAQAGLVSGRFYAIYDQASAPVIEDEAKRARYEARRDADLKEIHGRIGEVEVSRAYRIIGLVDSIVKEIEGELVPLLTGALQRWRRLVLIGDAVWAALLLVLFGTIAYLAGGEALSNLAGWLGAFGSDLSGGWPVGLILALVLLAGLFGAGHFWIRGLMAQRVARTLPERMGEAELNIRAAFLKNTRFFRSVFAKAPTGWGRRARKRIFAVREALAGHVQRINDIYTDPTGRRGKAAAE
ncbi:dynamin family protein [Azospirillum sp. SYSU D00513]|uniref:dynamin family protein n=1 Tax=Azospirillum sp. SYSU D00513 TaxID=2812561 RepID=UPI001A95A4C3|nr:dynamin family protein [Azospirillum sp. SYSU D00513]